MNTFMAANPGTGSPPPAGGAGQDLLAGLRDIHSASEPGWWPPAPGWWVLAVLTALAVFFAVRWLGRRWSERKRRRAYLAALERIEREVDAVRDPAAFLAAINRLFRAVALRAFPRSRSARLQGREWVAFVREHLPTGADGDALDALAAGPYQPNPDFDAAALRAAAETWVRRHG